jgi:glycosyltransferase involved in cell wall biosynthesis
MMGAEAMIGPKVSILIPVYNREPFIAACIQSAREQTYKNVEIIVVDNASTDQTYEIAKSFEKLDSRVRVFRNETNIGPVRNIRRCLEEATGPYGKILFSDDSIDAKFLEKSVPFLEDNEVGFVFSPVLMGPSPEKSGIFYRFASRTGVYTAKTYIQKALLGQDVTLSPGAALFRLKDLKQNYVLQIPSPSITDFDQHGGGPDLLVYLLTMVHYSKMAYINEPLSYFRMHEGSITISDKARYLDTCYRQARIWFASEYTNKKTFRKTVAYLWLQECRALGKRIDPSIFASAYLSKSFAFRPSDRLTAWQVAAQRKWYRLYKKILLSDRQHSGA